jgi:hypothetical protein
MHCCRLLYAEAYKRPFIHYSAIFSSNERKTSLVLLGGLKIIVLATGPKVLGFKPGRERWLFKGDKNAQHDLTRRGSKSVGPM